MGFKSILLIGFIAALSGCDAGIEHSDYIGGFVTQDGDCSAKGDTSINIDKQEVKIGFYCFLKKCAEMSGTTHQGGFFHFESKSGHYIKGRIAGEEAKGEWYLNMKGKSCSGHWVALKNS